jgi:hypothetical protein
MRSTALVSLVAAVCLTHGLALGSALAQAPAAGSDPAAKERAKETTEGAEPKRPPVPVAKPASPSSDPAKAQESEAKPGEAGAPGSKAARTSGPLPVGSGERAFTAPDCRWTGERVIATLMRDEVDVASQLTRFYSMFGCPTPHIGLALSCMVERDREQGPHDEKIRTCWNDPSVSRTAATPPAPEAGKEPAKPGAEDKPPQKN